MFSMVDVEAFCSRLLLATKYESASFEAAVRTATQGLSEGELKDLRTYFRGLGKNAEQLHSFRSAWRSYCDRFGILIEGDVEKVIIDALPARRWKPHRPPAV